jgi:hypothetical protein
VRADRAWDGPAEYRKRRDKFVDLAGFGQAAQCSAYNRVITQILERLQSKSGPRRTRFQAVQDHLGDIGQLQGFL